MNLTYSIRSTLRETATIYGDEELKRGSGFWERCSNWPLPGLTHPNGNKTSQY